MFKLGLYREIKNINDILKCLISLLEKNIKIMRTSSNSNSRVSKSKIYFKNLKKPIEKILNFN